MEHKLSLARPLAALLAVVLTSYTASGRQVAAPPTTGPAADTANESAGQPAAEAAPEADEPTKPWAITGGVDFLTQYVYRGYTVNSSGWIAQPTLDFAYTVFDSDSLTIKPHIGLWGNFTEDTGPDNGNHFSEGDTTAGVGISFHHFEFSANYQYQAYPNDSQGDVQELQLGVWYDDEHLWKDNPVINGIYPGFNFAQELNDTNDGDENAYFELTLEPTAQDWKPFGGDYPITFAAPMVLGMSGDGYYTSDDGHNSTFGYYSIGAKATMPLAFIAAGSWNVVLEVDYIRMLADSTESANSGDDDDFVGRLGFTFEF